MPQDKTTHAKTVTRLYHERRKQILGMLGGCCAVCGTAEQLEIDHVDPETKSFNVGKRLSSSWDVLLPELQKCQLLCKKHHIEKTTSEQGGPDGHGTLRRYQKLKCRCVECRAANAADARARKARRAA